MSETATSVPKRRRFRLRAAMVLPFILQILVTAGSIGYFSLKNGQQAVEHLNGQLQSQVQARIRDQLQNYFALPPKVNQLNQTALALGQIDLTDHDKTANYFWQQMKTFEELSYLAVVTEEGVFLGVGREDYGKLYLELMRPEDNNRYKQYHFDDRGKPSKLTLEKPYDFRQEPWYQKVVAEKRPTWSAIYQWNDNPEILSISCDLPILDKDQKISVVLASDFVLSHISTFLRNLKITESGRVFIVERSGLLVASSGSEAISRKTEGQSIRLSSLDTPDAVVQLSSSELKSRFGALEAIQKPEQFVATNKAGERFFIWVEPWVHDRDIDWLIVTAVPESDFMGPIHENTRNTLLLCLVALAISLFAGVKCSRWITEPVQKLDLATKQIARGNLDQAVNVDGFFHIVEVSDLADSFNTMSDQLLASFATLETQKNSFARFFPREYMKFLGKSDVTQVELGDHISKEMAVMFSDIRSFSSMSESMSPQENFDFVNAYLQRVSPEIRAHDGFVVKFLGDGMMAVFPNRVDDALAAGVAKVKKIEAYNREREQQGLSPIHVGVGIHVGYMMVGMVGEHNRIQGDAFSDTVNLTSRLEGLSKFYGASLLISGDVHRRLVDPKAYPVRFLDRAIVKGRSEPIAVFEVLDAESATIGALKSQTQEDFNRGITDYRAGRLADARVCFEKVLQVNPSDRAAEFYIQRIEILLLRGLPENWDGAWRFDEK